MFQQTKDWLKNPYPFPVTGKEKVLISFGKFVFLFLLLFKPFDFAQLADKSLYYEISYLPLQNIKRTTHEK